VTEIGLLLYLLDDPFNMFPLESVCKQLGNLVDDTNNFMYERRDLWSSSSPKYRSVQDEHDLEVVNLFIGSAFVLGQTAITQTVSIVRRLYNLAGEPEWLPKKKTDMMSMGAIIHPETGLSKIIIYDAVANYFKHHYEWLNDWSNATAAQQQAIDVALKLGLKPGNDDNLHVALNSLDMKVENMSLMGHEIQEWREHLGEKLKKQLQNHGLG
jgi:hypothetical protein